MLPYTKRTWKSRGRSYRLRTAAAMVLILALEIGAQAWRPVPADATPTAADGPASVPPAARVTEVETGLIERLATERPARSIRAGSSSPVMLVGPTTTFKQIGVGSNHTCGVLTSGAVTCWGYNYWGQAPHLVPGTFTQVSAGFDFSCGIRTGGTLTCWGYNLHGQAPHIRPGLFTQVSAGDYGACGIRIDATVTCWGVNDMGQSPRNLPGPFTQISVGGNHACGIRIGGAVTCWGDNSRGQAPAHMPGVFTRVSAAYNSTCGIRTTGMIVCWGDDRYGEAPTGVPGTFMKISGWFLHACGIRQNGIATCWGKNEYGQAPAVIPGRFVDVGAGFDFTCGIRIDRTVACWGNSGNELGVPNPISPVPAPTGHPSGVSYFPATQHTVWGSFLSFYNAHGGLKIFGLPLTQSFTEGGRTVQYFERSRLLQVGGRILITPLGTLLTADRSFSMVACCPPANQLWFPATRHTLGEPFLAFWRAHNGSLLFGNPISQPVREQNGDGTGRVYLVQYFQNARLEEHPELAGTPNVITLGQLGRQSLMRRGWL